MNSNFDIKIKMVNGNPTCGVYQKQPIMKVIKAPKEDLSLAPKVEKIKKRRKKHV